jgi:hypothetical protein
MIRSFSTSITSDPVFCKRSAAAQLLYFKLYMHPANHLCGLFMYSVDHMAVDIKSGPEQAQKALDELVEHGFIQVDPACDLVWVPEMAARVGDISAEKNTVGRAIRKYLSGVCPRKSTLVDRAYDTLLNTPSNRVSNPPSDGVLSGSGSGSDPDIGSDPESPKGGSTRPRAQTPEVDHAKPTPPEKPPSCDDHARHERTENDRPPDRATRTTAVRSSGEPASTSVANADPQTGQGSRREDNGAERLGPAAGGSLRSTRAENESPDRHRPSPAQHDRPGEDLSGVRAETEWGRAARDPQPPGTDKHKSEPSECPRSDLSVGFSSGGFRDSGASPPLAGRSGRTSDEVGHDQGKAGGRSDMGTQHQANGSKDQVRGGSGGIGGAREPRGIPASAGDSRDRGIAGGVDAKDKPEVVVNELPPPISMEDAHAALLRFYDKSRDGEEIPRLIIGPNPDKPDNKTIECFRSAWEQAKPRANQADLDEMARMIGAGEEWGHMEKGVAITVLCAKPGRHAMQRDHFGELLAKARLPKRKERAPPPPKASQYANGRKYTGTTCRADPRLTDGTMDTPEWKAEAERLEREAGF